MAFNLASISTQSSSRAPKGIIYGAPGIGKTTFGAGAGGLIIDTENGIPQNISVQHTPYFSSWTEIKECLDFLVANQYGVVVIDTIDWMLRRIEESVSGVDGSLRGMSNTLNRSHGGYGNGKQVLKNYVYQYLLPTFDRMVNSGTAVIMLAHADRQKLTSIEGAEYERSMPQIYSDLVEIMIEWSDFVGAACIIHGQRSLVLQETNQMVAKNRYGITGIIPLDWKSFCSAICG
jgi:hypothetical protein